MTLLDIGGGFQDSNFESIASSVHKALREEIPPHVRVIAEPGRYYARSVYTLACKVISRRRQIGDTRRTGPDMLYQNDGVYGSFMNVIMEKEVMRPSLITSSSLSHLRGETVQRQQGEHRYSIWGPTCDGLDCVVRDTAFESEVKVGDWLKYKNMGGKHLSTLRFSPSYQILKVQPLIDERSVHHLNSHEIQRVHKRSRCNLHRQRV